MFKNIVIPVDLADKQSLESIFSTAVQFASSFSAKVHLVYIMPDFGVKIIEDYLPRNWMKHQKEKYNKQFQSLMDKYIPKDMKVDFHIGRGSIYDGVINYSEKASADLIIVSAVRPQLKDYMLGSNASKIVRHSSISVLVVRE